MKVNMSQIPEEDEKPKFQKRDKSPMKNTAAFEKEDEDDDWYDGAEDEDEKDEEIRYCKSVVLLEDFGILFPLFEISTIDKDMQFVQRPKARWQYGITINKGIEASIRYPRVNVSVWFEREEVRDESFERIMKTLEENGFNVIRT